MLNDGKLRRAAAKERLQDIHCVCVVEGKILVGLDRRIRRCLKGNLRQIAALEAANHAEISVEDGPQLGNVEFAHGRPSAESRGDFFQYFWRSRSDARRRISRVTYPVFSQKEQSTCRCISHWADADSHSAPQPNSAELSSHNRMYGTLRREALMASPKLQNSSREIPWCRSFGRIEDFLPTWGSHGFQSVHKFPQSQQHLQKDIETCC